MRTAFFWDVTQRRVVILHRRFGTTYRFYLQGSTSPLRMGPIRGPETSVRISRSTLRNTSDERRSHNFRVFVTERAVSPDAIWEEFNVP
jgi:hypothetical protein